MKTKTYRVTFTPSGSYFFGNEKNFKYPNQENGGHFGELYYIRGENVPSQTTILGALRYLALPPEKRTYNAAKDDSAKRYIGAESFSFESAEIQEFGAIKSVSPLFITDGKTDYIPTPFDHNEEKSSKEYTPFFVYHTVDTIDGIRLYTQEYNAKKGITDTWMSVKDGKIESSMFESEVRIGINTQQRENAFFKKEYKILKAECSFVVYAEIDTEIFPPEPSTTMTVFLGQGKVPFAVRFAEEENKIDKKTKDLLCEKHKKLRYGFAYCQSDFLVNEQIPSGIFAVTKTRDHRSFQTEKTGKIKKGSQLHKLISAGSIFLFEKEDPFGDFTGKQKNAETIGMNHIIIIGGKNE